MLLLLKRAKEIGDADVSVISDRSSNNNNNNRIQKMSWFGQKDIVYYGTNNDK